MSLTNGSKNNWNFKKVKATEKEIVPMTAYKINKKVLQIELIIVAKIKNAIKEV